MRVTAGFGLVLVSSLLALSTLAASAPANSLYLLTSRWRDSSGQELPLSRFRGKPVVLTLIYTRCQYSCPLVLQEIKRIDSATTKKNYQIVLVSMDSETDTPEQLARFAESRNLDPKHWTLLASRSADDVRELAAVLGYNFKKTGKQDFSHSNQLTVLDSNGAIVHQKSGLGGEILPIVSAINRAASLER